MEYSGAGVKLIHEKNQKQKIFVTNFLTEISLKFWVFQYPYWIIAKKMLGIISPLSANFEEDWGQNG